VLVQGVKSQLWLAVVGGDFASSDEPQPLAVLSLDPEDEAQDAGWVHLSTGEAMMAYAVRMISSEKAMFLATNTGNVACGPVGHFNTRGQQGQWAQWFVDRAPNGLSFLNKGHKRYLGLDLDGYPQLLDEPVYFQVQQSPGDMEPSEPPVDASVLSPEDILGFKKNGFVIVRNAVPPTLVRAALRSINSQLGQASSWDASTPPQIALNLPVGLRRRIISESPRFWSALNNLLGPGNVSLPDNQAAQVALRFPQPPGKGEYGGDYVPDTKRDHQWHVDGFNRQLLHPFSVLCGVALSDQSRGSMGNLHVFPGAHLNQEVMQVLPEMIKNVESRKEKPDLGASEEVLMNPGDAVLVHQLLAHRVGTNTSEHIRYQLYFRMNHKDHAQLKSQIMNNPWVEYAI